MGLSDRTLGDLGLTRPDVEGACALPLHDAVDYAELEARLARSPAGMVSTALTTR